jgi:starch-binding outer membrane protein, SusD/RagB family
MTIFSLRSLGAAVFLGVLPLGGCGLLDTNQPNIIDPGEINSPEGAQAQRLGAIADFAFSKDGDGTQSDDGLILAGGLLSDEFIHSTTPPSQQEIDQRTTALINPTLSDVYRNLHKARRGLETAAAALRQFLVAPDETPDIAEMHSLAGFTYLYFGETFCSGVPFSRVSGDSLIFGSPETTTQTLERGLGSFDAALAEPGLSADDGTITNLTAVGRGRALLDLGRFAEAALAVAAVPTDFVYATEHAESPLRLQNAIWSYTNQGLWSVADVEGGVGLPYFSAQDPRVPADTLDDDGDGVADTGLDLITTQVNLFKYPDASADVSVADGVEARLIEAEAQLQTADLAGMTTTLNTLRQAFPDLTLANLTQPASQPEGVDLLFAERAFWLYATGHRLGDMRRLIRPVGLGGYGRTEDTVFPNGAYHKGGSYGSDVNLPIPIEEQNNPNSTGCLDRNP